MLLGDGGYAPSAPAPGEPVAVDLIAMELNWKVLRMRRAKSTSCRPLLRRQVWLTCGGITLAWAKLVEPGRG